MAVIRPARGSWPGLDPLATTLPGKDHVKEHKKALIEGHNYVAGFYGRRHIAQFWPSGKAWTPRDTTRALNKVLTYIVTPRDMMKDITFVFRCDLDGDVNANVKFDFPALGLQVTVPVTRAAPPAVDSGYLTGTRTGINSGDTARQLDVYLEAPDAPGTYIDLRELYAEDADLVAADLP